jgi:putative transcriptional regulator
MKTLRNKIRHFRSLRDGMTQAELAKAVGVSRQTIISLERGKYNPSVLLAMEIAAALKTTVEELFEIVPESKR